MLLCTLFQQRSPPPLKEGSRYNDIRDGYYTGVPAPLAPPSHVILKQSSIAESNPEDKKSSDPQNFSSSDVDMEAADESTGSHGNGTQNNARNELKEIESGDTPKAPPLKTPENNVEMSTLPDRLPLLPPTMKPAPFLMEEPIKPEEPIEREQPAERGEPIELSEPNEQEQNNEMHDDDNQNDDITLNK